MSDTNSLVLISRAAPLFPTRPSIASICRWATRGINGVVLSTIRVGGRRYTDAQRVAEFLEATNKRHDTPPSVTDSARAKRAAVALDRAGF
jgi:hypothetical protein